MISGFKIHIYHYYLGFFLCEVEYCSSTWLQAVSSVFSNQPGLLVWKMYVEFLKDWVCPHSFVLDLQAVCGNRCFKNSVRRMSSTMTRHVLQWAFAQHKEICEIYSVAVVKVITPYKQHILRLINTTLVSASGVRVPFCIEWPWWKHWNRDVCLCACAQVCATEFMTCC